MAGLTRLFQATIPTTNQQGCPMPTMRAKMQINRIERHHASETLHFGCVAKSGGYPEDGSDEDNTFAKFSPSGSLSLTVANPALIGKFNPGEKFYLDFTPAE
jgi:hypothetical protein